MILNCLIILISCWGLLLQANDSTNDGLCEHARAVERQAAGRLRVEAGSGPAGGPDMNLVKAGPAAASPGRVKGRYRWLLGRSPGTWEP